MSCRRAPPVLLPVAIAALASGAGAARPLEGQEAVGPGEAAEEIQEPAMARAPRQFRIALTAGALVWAEEAGRGSIDGGALIGLDVGRGVGPFVAFRAGGGYGRMSVANDTAEVEANQFVVDVVTSLRFAFGPLRGAGVVPFAAVGLAAVVHDPVSDALITKSQSSVAFGAGVDADLSKQFGLRAEWRRYVVDSENLFDPADRSGRGRVADRFYGAAYWKL